MVNNKKFQSQQTTGYSTSLSNKKGVMRVVEATVAGLVVLGALLLIAGTQRSPTLPPENTIEQWMPTVLEEIALNESLRARIVKDYNTSLSPVNNPNKQIIEEIDSIAATRINNAAYNHTIMVCALENLCALPVYPSDAAGDVYATERIVGAAIDYPEYAPKKLKLFIWIRR